MMDEDYPFRVKSTGANGTIYIECNDENEVCNVRGKLINGRASWFSTHEHYPNTMKLMIENFKDALKAATISSMEGCRMIYDQLVPLHTEASVHLPFVHIEDTMNRWRRSVRPPTPSSLVDYALLINHEKWKHFKTYAEGRDLQVTHVTGADESNSVIIGDSQFIQNLEITEFSIDSTFDSRPNSSDVYQVLSILGRIDDTMYPLAWALMEKKNRHAYQAVFHHFATVLAPNLHPSTITIDHEKALYLALKEVWPDVAVTRCFFHYTQALTRRLKNNTPQLNRRLLHWTDGQIFLRKLMGLALLPEADINEALNWLITNATDELKREFRDMINYYNNWWINRVGPEHFSVHNKEHRTNNAIESYHRLLNRRLGDRPSFWKFSLKMKDLQLITQTEITSMDFGLATRRTTPNQYILQNDVIDRLWYLYNNNFLDIPKFLSCSNFYIRAFNNHPRISDVAQVDSFIQAIKHNKQERPQILPVNVVIPVDDNNELNIIPADPLFIDNIISFYIYYSIDDSKCTLCNSKLVDIISLDCNHWYVCIECTIELIRLASDNNANLRCSQCFNVIRAFKKINII